MASTTRIEAFGVTYFIKPGCRAFKHSYYHIATKTVDFQEFRLDDDGRLFDFQGGAAPEWAVQVVSEYLTQEHLNFITWAESRGQDINIAEYPPHAIIASRFTRSAN